MQYLCLAIVTMPVLYDFIEFCSRQKRWLQAGSHMQAHVAVPGNHQQLVYKEFQYYSLSPVKLVVKTDRFVKIATP